MTIRRCILAGVAVVGLSLAVPTQARADISFGDLNDAFDNFGENWIEQLLDSICAWLLMPAQNLAAIAVPPAVPEPVIGQHLGGLPTDPAAAASYVDDLVADREERVAAIDAIVEVSQAAAAANTEQLATLSALNAANPLSIAQLLQIGNQADIVNASADATVIHYLSAQMAIEADRAYHEEQGREIAQAQYTAWADPIQGGAVQKATFQMPW